MTADAYSYPGAGNLEAMAGAMRYNAAIFGEFSAAASQARRVLDFGAGRGEFSNRFLMKIDCVEPDTAQQIFVKHDCFSSMSQIEYGYDFIYSINVMEHMRDDVEVLATLRSKMVPGGRLFLFVPAMPCLFSNMDRVVGHYRRYTPESLKLAIRSAGFTFESWKFFDGLGVPASLLYKLFRREGSVSHEDVRRYERWVFPASRLFDSVTRGSLFGKNLVAWAVNHGPVIGGRDAI